MTLATLIFTTTSLLIKEADKKEMMIKRYAPWPALMLMPKAECHHYSAF